MTWIALAIGLFVGYWLGFYRAVLKYAQAAKDGKIALITTNS